jgi:fimbrial chaperone protein
VRARGLLSIAILSSIFVEGRSAAAAGLQVSPVQVELTRSQSNAVISLRNDNEAATRYQVSIFAWDQDPSGEMKLGPTRDLIAFPLLISLGPGETRNIRVGTTPEKFGPMEKTYRVFVEEMPPAEKHGNQPAVQVRMRVGIPVFLEPAARVNALKLEWVEAKAGGASFRLLNDGNVRVRPKEVAVAARDAEGAVVARQRWDGWYVLAAGARDYRWTVPQGGCGKVRSLVAEAILDDGQSQTAALQSPAGVCGP